MRQRYSRVIETHVSVREACCSGGHHASHSIGSVAKNSGGRRLTGREARDTPAQQDRPATTRSHINRDENKIHVLHHVRVFSSIMNYLSHSNTKWAVVVRTLRFQ
jgi:hypothetical protein